MKAWDVYLEDANGDESKIDTVFYDNGCDAEYVQKGLIDHDGYDSSIRVMCEATGEEYPQTEPKTLDTFIKQHGVTMRVERVSGSKEREKSFGPGARHFAVTLVRDGHTPMAVSFSQGSAYKVDPTIADVLDCLASDASGVIDSQSFEDWCADYGYDTDSRKAESTYSDVTKQAESLEQLLGRDAFRELVYDIERK